MSHFSANSAIWHPFTQMQLASPPLKIKRGEGIWLELEEGGRLIDCISSWWVNLHGHCHPAIAQAIYTQAQQLEHVLFAGCTHQPAEQLARELLALLPSPLSKIFYSDNGSTAVEVALKMAYQYWQNRDEPQRQRFVCFKNGYHGDTVGAMSLSGRSPFTEKFAPLLFDAHFVDYPATCENDTAAQIQEQKALTEIALQLQMGTVAAVVIEPLVQGAGGMQMCRPQFLQQLQGIVKASGALLIYDEVMTGFGRTGELFACGKSQTTPDIICLSKGITGGFLPLAATACSDAVYSAFLSADLGKTLYHGHSYTANPLGCAAALASLKLLRQNSTFVQMEHWHREGMGLLMELPCVANVRFCGTIAACTLNFAAAASYFAATGENLRQLFMRQGLLLRPLGKELYLMPPYCIAKEQLFDVYTAIKEVLLSAVAAE